MPNELTTTNDAESYKRMKTELQRRYTEALIQVVERAVADGLGLMNEANVRAYSATLSALNDALF